MSAIIGIIGILVFLCFISYLVISARFNVPKDASRDTKVFAKVLPAGYTYPYFLGDAGYAINVKERKILIATQDRLRTYNVNQIQSCTYKKGGTEPTFINSRNKEKEAHLRQRQIFDSSGIFIEFTKFARPTFQIKFCNEKELQSSLAILQQFFEGTLK